MRSNVEVLVNWSMEDPLIDVPEESRSNHTSIEVDEVVGQNEEESGYSCEDEEFKEVSFSLVAWSGE